MFGMAVPPFACVIIIVSQPRPLEKRRADDYNIISGK